MTLGDWTCTCYDSKTSKNICVHLHILGCIRNQIMSNNIDTNSVLGQDSTLDVSKISSTDLTNKLNDESNYNNSRETKKMKAVISEDFHIQEKSGDVLKDTEIDSNNSNNIEKEVNGEIEDNKLIKINGACGIFRNAEDQLLQAWKSGDIEKAERLIKVAKETDLMVKTAVHDEFERLDKASCRDNSKTAQEIMFGRNNKQ